MALPMVRRFFLHRSHHGDTEERLRAKAAQQDRLMGLRNALRDHWRLFHIDRRGTSTS